jgi:hypothetical protein
MIGRATFSSRRKEDEMRRTGWITAALALVVALTACGNGDEAPGPAEETDETTEGAEGASVEDPLVGTWTTVLTPELEEQAAAEAGLESGGPSHADLFGANGPATIELTFENGQMVHTSSVEGAEPEVGWSGRYEIVDEDTFVAGDTGDLYIEYTFSIDGDQLEIDMVRDDYPTVSEEELAGEIYAQTVIYESAPFTRET